MIAPYLIQQNEKRYKMGTGVFSASFGSGFWPGLHHVNAPVTITLGKFW